MIILIQEQGDAMKNKMVELMAASAEYRFLIERLCTTKAGEWRPGALGYILVQVRERVARVEALDIMAFLELKQLLQLACKIATTQGDVERTLRIAFLANQSAYIAYSLYRKKVRERTSNRDMLELINKTGSDVVELVVSLTEA